MFISAFMYGKMQLLMINHKNKGRSMIKHIVLFKFAKHVSRVQIENVMLSLKKLMDGPIPEIKSFNHGENCSVEHLNNGFNYGFVMDFESVRDRDHYVKHADHIRVADEEIIPLLEDGLNSVIVLDYEFI